MSAVIPMATDFGGNSTVAKDTMCHQQKHSRRAFLVCFSPIADVPTTIKGPAFLPRAPSRRAVPSGGYRAAVEPFDDPVVSLLSAWPSRQFSDRYAEPPGHKSLAAFLYPGPDQRAPLGPRQCQSRNSNQ
jgi:hypothetical protein